MELLGDGRYFGSAAGCPDLAHVFFSLLYFSREVSDFINGREKKPFSPSSPLPPPLPLPPPPAANAEIVEPDGVFGRSKAKAAIFFADKDGNSNINLSENGDSSKNIVAFAEGNEQEKELGEEDIFTDLTDITDMFGVECFSFSSDDAPDSGDAASGDDNLGAVKALGALRAETLNLLKVIGGSNVGRGEKLQASETLRELEGTNLFAQVENAAGGASRVELMRLELGKVWNEAYEAGDNGDEQMDINF
jgi:hypothetical protein